MQDGALEVAPVAAEEAKAAASKMHNPICLGGNMWQLTGTMLGRGAVAKVLQAWCRKTNMTAAVKVVNRQAISAWAKRQTKVEAMIWQQLTHPNIVQCYGHVTFHHFGLLFLEHMHGGELFDYIVNRKDFLESDAVQIIRQIVSAVEYLHSKKICHRDLKPENVLLVSTDHPPTVKIADFGAAKQVLDGVQCNTPCGTASYAAPEVVQGGHDLAVDMWSIGCVCYVLVSGCFPFSNMAEAQRGKVVFPAQKWAMVSDNAKCFIRSLLQVDPTLRLTAEQALKHAWLREEGPPTPLHTPRSLRELLQQSPASKKLADEYWSASFTTIRDRTMTGGDSSGGDSSSRDSTPAGTSKRSLGGEEAPAGELRVPQVLPTPPTMSVVSPASAVFKRRKGATWLPCEPSLNH